jgi:hypothetical protein
MGRVNQPGWVRYFRREPGVIALLVANLVPLAGVLFLGWDAFRVVFLYWLENVVIGVFHVRKMLLARGPIRDPQNLSESETARGLAVFFALHYGFFTLIHGFFVVIMLGALPRHLDQVVHEPGGFSFKPPPGAVADALADAVSLNVILASLVLVAEHAYLFWHDYVKGREYLHTHAKDLMFQPYGRIVVIHVTILFGGFLMVKYDFPPAAAVLLVVLKTLLDLLGYLWQRHRAGQDRS